MVANGLPRRARTTLFKRCCTSCSFCTISLRSCCMSSVLWALAASRLARSEAISLSLLDAICFSAYVLAVRLCTRSSLAAASSVTSVRCTSIADNSPSTSFTLASCIETSNCFSLCRAATLVVISANRIRNLCSSASVSRLIASFSFCNASRSAAKRSTSDSWIAICRFRSSTSFRNCSDIIVC